MPSARAHTDSYRCTVIIRYQKTFNWFMTKWHFSLYLDSTLHKCRIICKYNETHLNRIPRSINYHKRDIKMNHTELWNVVKIIWLQDKKEETYFELYFIDSYLFITTFKLLTCTYLYRIYILKLTDIWNQDALFFPWHTSNASPFLS